MLDIAGDFDDIVIGRNWHAPETWLGETFRWVTNDATLFLPTTRRTDYEVFVELEPGPSVAGLGANLSVADADGTVRYEGPLDRRVRIAVTIDAARWPKMHELRFHCDRPGTPLASDGRTLNFRCFAVSSRVVPPDLFVRADGLRPGFGWYEQEFAGDLAFRWANVDAEIEWLDPDRQELIIDVEPGPGLRSATCTLVIDDASGTRLLERVLGGRETLRIPRPREVPSAIRFNVLEPGDPLSEDARILKFRAFAAHGLA